MYELLKLFFNICLFKKGPEDVPGTNIILSLIIPVYVMINFLILILASDFFNSLLQVLVGLMLTLVLSWLILFFSKKLPRYLQTVSALVGIDTVISFFALPVMASMIGQGSAIAYLSLIFLMFWHWVVSGHIFSKALDQPFSFGLGLAFLFILASTQCMALMFPDIILTEQGVFYE